MQDVVVQIRSLLSDSGTTFAVVLAAAVLLVVVLLIGSVLVVLRIYSPRGRLQLLLESRAPRRSTNPWATRIIVLVALVGVVAATASYAARPSSCMSCHQEPDYAKGLQDSVHAGVTCVQCHGGAGPAGWADDSVRYAGWLWAYYGTETRTKPGSGAYVEPTACIRCHAAVREGVTSSKGVLVRHSDFLGIGYECSTCHSDIGHTASLSGKAPSVMNVCLSCHDDVTESADCETCHEQDLGLRVIDERQGVLSAVGISGSGNCYSCHEPDPCTSCHGVTMPHPPGWSPQRPAGATAEWAHVGSRFEPGSHIREGFSNREACWRCHHKPESTFVPDDAACSCHGQLGFLHGGPAWVAEHGQQATGRKTGVYSDCASCHSAPDTFCLYCHPASYSARYAPLSGPDNYTASPGYPRTLSSEY